MPNENEKKLLECPFCGLHEIDYCCGLRNGKPFAFVRCANCEAGFREDDCCEDLTPEQLLVQLKVAWNDRPIGKLLDQKQKMTLRDMLARLCHATETCLDYIASRLVTAPFAAQAEIKEITASVRGVPVGEALEDARRMLAELDAGGAIQPTPAPAKHEEAADA